jgi:DNA modification methylase
MIYPNDFINKNICGKSEEILLHIPDNVIDLTITSPPYDKLRNYKGTIGVKTYDGGYTIPFREIAKELFRITKEGGIVVWVVNDQVKNGGETGTSFKMALDFMDLGFKLHDTMIYQKNGSPYPEITRYSQVFEYMFVFLKGDRPNTVNLIKDKPNRWAGKFTFGKPTSRDKDGHLKKSKKFKVADYGFRYNVWYINNGKGYTTKDDYAYTHPAMYPEQLAEDHILSWTKEGNLVLDPMCGAGTTQKMAKINNRNFIGIDNVEEYVELSDKRVKDVVSYTKEHPNPKCKFIETREQILKRRNAKRKKKEEK